MLRHLRELRVADASEYESASSSTPSIFAAGELVDVIGTSKGRGFQGVVKRHGFRGGPQDPRPVRPLSGRRARSARATTPGPGFKGLRMAGQMGNDRVTVQNLEGRASRSASATCSCVRGAVPGRAQRPGDGQQGRAESIGVRSR